MKLTEDEMAEIATWPIPRQTAFLVRENEYRATEIESLITTVERLTEIVAELTGEQR